MVVIAISDSIELICSKEFAERYHAEVAELEAEAKARDDAERWERETWQELKRLKAEWERTHSVEVWDYYSDLYKDYWGVRPR